MAEGQTLLSGLDNLSVFEGVPEDEKRNALLAAALQMMQPTNPVTQGGAVAQLSSGVGAGLQSLDSDLAKRQAVEQQKFQNIITERGAKVSERNADSTAQNANSTSQNAMTNAAAVGQDAAKFEGEAGLRSSQVELNKANAAWLARRHDGSPADASAKAITAAQLDEKRVNAMMQVLTAADPARYQVGTNPDGTPIWNEALAMSDAFDEIAQEVILANPNLPFTLRDPAQAAQVGENVSALTGGNPLPGSVSQLPQPGAGQGAAQTAAPVGPPVVGPIGADGKPAWELKPGINTTFNDGSVWTLSDGQAFQVKAAGQ